MITQHFEEKSGQKTLPEALNYGNSYKMFNDGSVEVEVGELLYGFVRILKPRNIFETGSYKGWSAAYMAQGLKENGLGKITTIEYNRDFIKQSEDLWIKLGLNEWVNCVQGLSYNFDPKGTMYDLILLDTEPQVRFKEMVKFYPNLKEGGYIFIHDANYDLSQNTHNKDHPEVDPWPFGPIPQIIKEWVNSYRLRPMFFPNPRGMCGFYKVKFNEYKWR